MSKMLVILLSIIGLCSSKLSYAEAGYRPISDSNLPACFSSLRDKIFRLLAYADEPVKVIPNERYEELLKRSHESAMWHHIAAIISACKDQGLKECPVRFAKACTAFLWLNPKTVITNKHCFIAADYQNILEFELSDNHSYKQQYRSSDKTCSWQAIGSTDVKSKHYPDTDVTDERSDFVRLGVQLPQPQPPPINFATQPPAENQTLYIVGFPNPTTKRSEVADGAKDSDGWGLYVTQGKLLSTIEMLHRVYDLPRAELEPLQGMFPDDRFEDWPADIYLDADYNAGMSGAPVINQQCELVGIARASLCDDTDLTNEYCDKGVKVLSSKWLQSL